MTAVSHPLPDLSCEDDLWLSGFRRIAGLDEVGRGAWAGPVVAAAVILPCRSERLGELLGQVDDSKRLPPATRDRLDRVIRGCAAATAVGSVPADTIDRIGIAAATRLAMLLALASLHISPDVLLIDYLKLPAIPLPQRSLPHGDAISLSIAAASIVAKVARDRWMASQDARYPAYGFSHNKGYGTPQHQQALALHGRTALHRVSFGSLATLPLS